MRRSSEFSLTTLRYAEHYARLLERHAPRLDSTSSSEALEQLKTEYDNITSTVDFCCEFAFLEPLRSLGLHLIDFYSAISFIPLARDSYQRILQTAELHQMLELQAIALFQLSSICAMLAEIDAAEALLDAGRALAAQLDSPDLHQLELGSAVSLYLRSGRPAQAIACSREAIEYCDQHGLPVHAARLRCTLGTLLARNRDYAAALQQFLAALEALGPARASRLGSRCLLNIGTSYQLLGEDARANNYFAQALPQLERLGDRRGYAGLLLNAAKLLGRDPLDSSREALAIFTELGDMDGSLFAHSQLSELYAAAGASLLALEHNLAALELTVRFRHFDQAGQKCDSILNLLLALGQTEVAAQLNEALGLPLPPQELYEQCCALLREQLALLQRRSAAV